MDDIDPEIMRLIREALAEQRPHADYFGFSADRSIAELGVAQELCEALAAAGRPLASAITSRAQNDPPDCEGVDTEGRRIAIEVTELVDPAAIIAAKSGRPFNWAE